MKAILIFSLCCAFYGLRAQCFEGVDYNDLPDYLKTDSTMNPSKNRKPEAIFQIDLKADGMCLVCFVGDHLNETEVLYFFPNYDNVPRIAKLIEDMDGYYHFTASCIQNPIYINELKTTYFDVSHPARMYLNAARIARRLTP